MIEKIYNWAKDYVDERNYSYSEVVWSLVWDSKDFVLLEDWESQNQYKSWYNMWCVYFASSMHDNNINRRDWIKDRSFWWELCDSSKTRSSIHWDYIINWPKLLKSLWLIEWYVNISSFDEMIDCLNRSMPVHTWSNQINWTKTNNSKDKKAIIWKWSWHCFHIIWYNKSWNIKFERKHIIPNNCFIIKDSSDMFDFWYFYIWFEDIWVLFDSKFTFINDTKILLNYKNKIMENIKLESSKKAFELWIWNWENPSMNITREEAAAMIYRMYEKLKG